MHPLIISFAILILIFVSLSFAFEFDKKKPYEKGLISVKPNFIWGFVMMGIWTPSLIYAFTPEISIETLLFQNIGIFFLIIFQIFGKIHWQKKYKKLAIAKLLKRGALLNQKLNKSNTLE